MALLTVSELREHVRTDLSDTALQRLADAAERIITDRAGPLASQTEHFDARDPYDHGDTLFLARTPGSITSVSERDGLDADPEALAGDDYEIRGKRRLVRRGDGTNPRVRWADHVTVIYVPVDDTDLRSSVQIELVRLMVEHRGLSSESVGDWSGAYGDYQQERERILSALSVRQRLFA